MTILGLFLNESVRTGGHKRYLELLGGLTANGHRVIAFMNRVQEQRPQAVETLELDVRKKRFQPKSRAFAAAVLHAIDKIPGDAGKIDWILVFGETHLTAAVALKRRLGVPILYSHRSNAVREALISLSENRRYPRKLVKIALDYAKSRFYERAIARRADVIVFQSPYDRDDFLSRERSCSDRSLVIRGNIGEPRFKAVYANANRSQALRRILFIGTFGERKGVKYLLEAAAILAARGRTELSYDLVGFWSQSPEFEGFVREAGIADRVRFHGRMADPFPLIIESDLLVVPSLFDSYPNTVLEALHAGTPVIASATGGIPDMLRHEELLFPIRDAQAIADRIERCVAEPGFYARVKQLCAERKSDFLFDWTGKFIDVMKEKSGGKS